MNGKIERENENNFYVYANGSKSRGLKKLHIKKGKTHEKLYNMWGEEDERKKYQNRSKRNVCTKNGFKKENGEDASNKNCV